MSARPGLRAQATDTLFTSIRERRFFKIAEVAALFELTVQGVHLWIKKGKIRDYERTSAKGKYRIRREELIRLLKLSGRQVPGLWTRAAKKTKRVLVIDDYEPIRRLVITAFKDPSYGVEVRAAATVEDGILLAGQYQPDVIVLDYIFKPDRLQGDTALTFVRNAKLLRGVKVLGIGTNMQVGREMLKAGADAFLVKPYSIRELRHEVLGLLSAGDQPKTEKAPSHQRSVRTSYPN